MFCIFEETEYIETLQLYYYIQSPIFLHFPDFQIIFDSNHLNQCGQCPKKYHRYCLDLGHITLILINMATVSVELINRGLQNSLILTYVFMGAHFQGSQVLTDLKDVQGPDRRPERPRLGNQSLATEVIKPEEIRTIEIS